MISEDSEKMISIGYNNYLGMKIPFLDYGQGSGYIPIEKKTIAVGGFVGTGAAASAWNALSTTGKVGLGVIGGGLAVGTYDWLFGKKATPQALNQNPVQNTVTKTNTVTNTYTSNVTGDWSTNIISNSPYASQKKGSMGGSATPSVNVVPSVSVIPSQTTKADQAQGTDWATLAAIAGVALVAYGYTSRKEK